MNEMANNSTPQICVNCGQNAAFLKLRDEIFGRGINAVIIENIPMIECRHCGITYLSPKTSQMIDEICAHPEKHTVLAYRAIAQLA